MVKIIKRVNGDQLKISVYAWLDNNKITYKTSVSYRLKGKKKWLDLPDTMSDWEIRDLSLEDREIHRWENTLRFVSQDEILEAQIEFWETLKPKYPLF